MRSLRSEGVDAGLGMALDIVGLCLLLALLYGIALIVRRRLLSRHGGTFELSFRVRAGTPGAVGCSGIGRYSGESLEWFRIFSLSPRPKRVWARDLLEYAGRRSPAGAEEMSLYAGHVVVGLPLRPTSRWRSR